MATSLADSWQSAIVNDSCGTVSRIRCVLCGISGHSTQ